MAEPVWGEEGLTVNILHCDDSGALLMGQLKSRQNIRVKIQAYYDNQAIKDIKISSANRFKLLNTWIENNLIDQKSSYTVFELEAPSDSGIYTLTFEGLRKDGKLVSFQNEIEVTKGDSILFYTIGACFVIILALAIGNIGNVGR